MISQLTTTNTGHENVSLVTLLLLTALAQDNLKPGFQLLDSGKFGDGAQFFKIYLTTRDSTNRTALLCDGRYIGLSGNLAGQRQRAC